MGKQSRLYPRKVKNPSSNDAKLVKFLPVVRISIQEKQIVEAALLRKNQNSLSCTGNEKKSPQNSKSTAYSLRTRSVNSNAKTMNTDPVTQDVHTVQPQRSDSNEELPPRNIVTETPPDPQNNKEPETPTPKNQPNSPSESSETTDDDDDMEMQVLEKQVESDVESIPLRDDTDEESSLLSPSALPPSQLVRSVSSRKKKTPPPTTSEFIVPSTSTPVPRVPLKRGRGRPRKALEDVKSVSGKLYRKKLAEKISNPQQRQGPAAPLPRLNPPPDTTLDATVNQRNPGDVYEPTAEDYFEESHEPFERLHRWKDRSTFVYAKHKFVSNENKFRCDVCQVSFTALSSLKRHYGTIYHKQQEASGSSNLDLSDILRPETSSNTEEAPPVSRRGRGRPPLAARTSSFVRRSAVDNIKKYYAAADAARRRREKFTLFKQTRRRKPLVHSDYLYSSASPYSESEPDNSVLHSAQNGNAPPTFAPWRSSVWKGIGPPHFTCEYCGKTGFEKKFDFTAHVFEHREQESRVLALTCPDCQVQFPNTQVLDHHFDLFNHGIGIHRSRNKPVKKLTCEVCASRFSKREYYDKHMETHKRSAFKCLRCNEMFEFKFLLTEHIKLNHMNEQTSGVQNQQQQPVVAAVDVPVPLKPKIELFSDSVPVFQPIRKPVVKKPEAPVVLPPIPPNTFVLHDGVLEKPSESIIQKFFESQVPKSPDISVGAATTENGKIVFQLENSFMLNEDACNLSPLTIEIPNIHNSEETTTSAAASSSTSGAVPRPVPISRIETPDSLHSTDSNSSTQTGVGCGVKNHKASIQPDNPLQCQDCGKTFEHRKSLISHVRYFSGTESYSCSLCGKSFKLKHHVARHKRIHHNIEASSCSSIDESDESRKKMRKSELESSFSRSNYEPVIDSNGQTVFKCLICKKFYPSKHQISSHLSYHKRTQAFKCNGCNAAFKLEEQYNTHVCGTLKCDSCPDKVFTERKELLKHMRETHANLSRKPLPEHEVCRCPVCPLVFPTQTDLNTHLDTSHSSEYHRNDVFDEHEDDDEEEDDDDDEEDMENSSSPEFELLELN